MTRTPRRPRDTNQLGKLMVDILTGDEGSAGRASAEVPRNPATEFARQGGLKGGRARADALSPEMRSEIARQAAAARWRKDDS